MVLCPFGSAPNNADLGVVRVDATFINQILPNGIEWFNSYLWLVPPFYIDVPSFCNVDPPEMPALISNDNLIALMTGDWRTLGDVAWAEVKAMIQNWAWYYLCHCVSSTTPAPPDTPPAPDGAPVATPGGGLSQECFHDTFASVEDQGSGEYQVGSWLYHTTTPAPKRIRYIYHDNLNGTPHRTKDFRVLFTQNGAGAPILELDRFGVFSLDETFVVPPGYTEFRVNVTYSGSSTDTFVREVIGYCGDTVYPISPTDPGGCCAETQGLLYQIYNLLNTQQRFSTPFAYIRATEHSGLTGTDSFLVDRIVGIQVQITTLPSYLGIADGTPDYVFDAGWVSIGTEDGYSETRRLDGVSIVWLPQSAPVATAVGYTLSPNVVARITELRAEP